MSKAIFRVSGIKTTSDLQGIGKHNLDRVSHTNPDIDTSKSNENITLKNCVGSYNEMFFYYITRDLQKQHEEQMKTVRKSRQKSFKDKINDDNADIACEFLMSASPEFFEGKSKKEIRQWGQISLDFITQKIGIEDKNILHAVIHMDEKTPHLHVVAVPLIEKYDGRKKKDVLAISRKHFIKTREDMAQVQTDYVKYLNNHKIHLERGEEKSNAKHLDVASFKLRERSRELEHIEQDLSVNQFEMDKLQEKKQLLEKELHNKKNEMLELSSIVPERLNIKAKKETKTEVVKTGFFSSKTEEKETGNLIISRAEYKKMKDIVEASVVIKKDYDRLQKTDVVKENNMLRQYASKVTYENNKLKKDNYHLHDKLNSALQINRSLEARINDLRAEIQFLYQSTKEFLKERTSHLQAFKEAMKDFTYKVKERVTGGEFEGIHQRELNRERDRGLER